MKVYVVSVIFTAKKDTPFLLTKQGTRDVLPIFEVEHPEYYAKELFNNIRNLFESGEIQVSGETTYNFQSVQEDSAIKYIEENEDIDFINKEDFLVIYGGTFVDFTPIEQFQWTEYAPLSAGKGYSNNEGLNELLDLVITKSVL